MVPRDISWASNPLEIGRAFFGEKRVFLGKVLWNYGNLLKPF